MDESRILSTDEVAAIAQATNDNHNDLDALLNSSNGTQENRYFLNYKALSNITELLWFECEKAFSSFAKKKIAVKTKEVKFDKLGKLLANKADKHIFTTFQFTPNNDCCLSIIDMSFLQQMINITFGGVIDSKEAIMDSPGNIGKMLAEKLNEIILNGFMAACKEYGKINFTKINTVTSPKLISKMNMEDEVYSMEYIVNLQDIETKFTLQVPVGFLQQYIPVTTIPEKDQMNKENSWRTIIENQVIDSMVTIRASLPTVTIKVNDLLALKSGDLIPIGDPTAVNICLNNVELFRASAAESNSTRIVKILSEN